jgi:hypothetical protein
VTLGLSIGGGALSGFLCSKIGTLEKVFEDEPHWDELAHDST